MMKEGLGLPIELGDGRNQEKQSFGFRFAFWYCVIIIIPFDV